MASEASGVDAEAIADWIAEDFGIGIIGADRVSEGADALAATWKVSTGESLDFAAKVSSGRSSSGLMLTEILGRAGTPGVPRPIPNREGRPWSERGGLRLSMVDWLEGSASIETELTLAQWSAFGGLMNGVHGSGREVPAAAALAEVDRRAHVPYLDRIRELERILERPGGDSLSFDLADVWAEASSRIADLISMSIELAGSVDLDPSGFVTCHGDPHLGNLIVERRQLWLIDWDDAVLAPRERDLLFFLGGVLPDSPIGPRQQEAFFDGYGPGTFDLDCLAYFRCVRALEDLGEPAGQILDGDGGSEGPRANALAIVRGVLSPTGLVEQAITPTSSTSSRCS